MKTYSHLYPQLCSFETLYTAYRAARRGKRGKVGVAAFEREQERELFQLQHDLRTETYTPGPYHTVGELPNGGRAGEGGLTRPAPPPKSSATPPPNSPSPPHS
jgi:hypothetical protein